MHWAIACGYGALHSRDAGGLDGQKEGGPMLTATIAATGERFENLEQLRNPFVLFGADGEGRTPMPLRALEPKSSGNGFLRARRAIFKRFTGGAVALQAARNHATATLTATVPGVRA